MERIGNYIFSIFEKSHPFCRTNSNLTAAFQKSYQRKGDVNDPVSGFLLQTAGKIDDLFVDAQLAHPSYQAWSYATLIKDYNQTVRDEQITLTPCAYLHNYPKDQIITNPRYEPYITEAPPFFQSDAGKLREFIKKYVKYGDSKDILYKIENGRLRPSKQLADNLVSMLKGNQEFIMLDDQKVVYETALSMIRKASADKKQVLIVKGGPGTGKSVVAINLLVETTRNRLKSILPRAYKY